ncbi:MAG: hypothetical protein Kow0074_10390 [Candidatus Zixiibacteriota bacterium]
MRVLAFDMTSSRITVGLAENRRAIGRWDATARRGRSGTLDALIEKALSEAGWDRGGISGLGLVTGPGSLTATRIGWATASGWALAAGIPVTGWPSQAVQHRWWHDATLRSQAGIEVDPHLAIECVIHHRGDEFYRYDLSGTEIPQCPDSICLDEWVPINDTATLLVGSGILGYRDRWISAVGSAGRVVPEENALVGGDTLAMWAAEALEMGHVFDPLESPLDYGLPPVFRKSA